ncbi:hypothetical protein LU293_05335 [Moraxella nasovis]|uniref:hypothetical protein n=1 Tax=Moraxella nasovis TaxID=2904121 RepID=UPI001F60C536|nr:hypothetical protein [Moraxella nasovis]UNU74300.1 hypothetical protein LU293_05335 [Moraxella nasovis]
MRYQSNRPKRRFLSSVSCPKCKAYDAIVQVEIFIPKPDEYIECTQCGHTERRPTLDDAKQMRENNGYANDNVGIVRFKSKQSEEIS